MFQFFGTFLPSEVFYCEMWPYSTMEAVSVERCWNELSWIESLRETGGEGRGRGGALSGHGSSWSSDRKTFLSLLRSSVRAARPPQFAPWDALDWTRRTVSPCLPVMTLHRHSPTARHWSNSRETLPGSTPELNDFYLLLTHSGHEDGDCILPACRHVGPGWLGSGLFGVQHSDGPESGQQTQVGPHCTCFSPAVLFSFTCVCSRKKKRSAAVQNPHWKMCLFKVYDWWWGSP